MSGLEHVEISYTAFDYDTTGKLIACVGKHGNFGVKSDTVDMCEAAKKLLTELLKAFGGVWMVHYHYAPLANGAHGSGIAEFSDRSTLLILLVRQESLGRVLHVWIRRVEYPEEWRLEHEKSMKGETGQDQVPGKSVLDRNVDQKSDCV